MEVLSKICSVLETRYRRAAFWLLCLIVLSVVAETAGIGLIFYALNALAQHAEGSFDGVFSELIEGKSAQALVFYAGILIAFVFYTKASLLSVLAFAQSKFAYGLQADLSSCVYKGYLHDDYVKTLKIQSGEVIRNCTTDISLFVSGGIIPCLTLTAELLVVTAVTTLLLVVQPVEAITAAVLFSMFAVLMFAVIRPWLRRWGKDRQASEALRIRSLTEGIMTLRETKLYGLESWFGGRYSRSNKAVATATGKFQAMQHIPRIMFELVLVHAIFIYLGYAMVSGIAISQTYANASLFALAAFRLLPSANRIMSAFQQIKFASPSIATLSEIIKGANAVQENPLDTRNKTKDWDKLCVDKVCFSYPGQAPTLQDISFEAHRGSFSVLMGPSGSGKSTLVDVMLGLLMPQSGSISFLDSAGQLLACGSQKIAYVPQSVSLLSDTLRRNIAFGVEDADINEHWLNHVIQKTALTSLVAKLDQGLGSVIGDGSSGISGGEKQRIGIARALYRKPELIILDEPTSALDPRSEDQVLEFIASIQSSDNVSVFLITHKSKPLAYATDAYFMEAGRLVKSTISDDKACINQ